MLFNLNSIDERDPANFRNAFSQNLVISANSFISFLGGTITRTNLIYKITLATPGSMIARLAPYDIRTFVIPAAIYTPNSFIAQLNLAFPNYNTTNINGSSFYGMSLQASLVETDPTDLKIAFNFANMEKGAGDTSDLSDGYLAFIGYSTLYNLFTAATIEGKALPPMEPNAVAGQPVSLIGGGNNPYAVSCIPPPDAVYTRNTLHSNNGAMNICPWSDAYPKQGYFFVAQPNLTNCKVLFGSAIWDDVGATDSNYLIAPIIGSNQYTNPGAQVNNCPAFLNFKADGDLNINVYNYETAAFVDLATIVGPTRYQPGDLIMCGLKLTGKTGTGDVLNENRAITPSFEIATGNGLAFMYLMELDYLLANRQWNIFEKKGNDLSEYVVNNVDLIGLPELYYDLFWQPNEKEAGGNPIGVRFSAGNATDNNYHDCNLGLGAQWYSGTGGEIFISTPSALYPWVTNVPYFRRYTVAGADRGTLLPGECSTVKIANSATGIQLAGFPWMITTFFQWDNDSAALPGASIQAATLLGDINSASIIQFYPLQQKPHDVTIFFSDGTQIDFILLDIALNRLNIVGGSMYYLRVEKPNTVTNRIRVMIYDIFSGVEYYAESNTNSDIEKIMSIGGVNTAGGNYEKYFAGHIAHFRIHTLSQTAATADDVFNSTWSSLKNFMATGERDGNFWWGYRKIAFTPPETDGYTNISYTDPDTTLTPVFEKDLLQVQQNNWFDFSTPYFQHAVSCPNIDRVTNQLEPAYMGTGVGFVAANSSFNPDGNEELIFTQDVNGLTYHPVTNVTPFHNTGGGAIQKNILIADVNDVELDDKVINVEIPNLPHHSYNGVARTQDKTIGQIPITPINSERLVRDNIQLVTAYPPHKVWIPLNNPGSISVNELQVKLTDIRGVQLTSADVEQETNIQIEIATRSDIFS